MTLTEAGAARTAPAARAIAVMGAIVVAAILAMMYTGKSGPVTMTGPAPADGAVLGADPGRVTLALTGDPEVRSAHVAVVGPDGAPVTRGLPRVEGATVVQEVVAAARGTYRMAYHLELTSGANLSGSSVFTIGDGSAAVAVPPPPAATGHGHEMRRDVTTVVFLLVDFALIAVLVLVLLPRRRR
ncbi:copper resistance protein CopC [Actinoplanes sp. G11-F43]|uniref:copper resistance protein CopC n=1 Tax=Actinoplanes sp. G11-F43 TaxID=3424130 RepID=UPI003D32BA0B